MKRKLLLAGCAVLLSACMTAGSFAYFSKETRAVSFVTTGKIDVRLKERGADGDDAPADGIVILPGSRIRKAVSAENRGAHPAYVRMKLLTGVSGDSLPADGCLLIDPDLAHWTFRDGWYYLNEALPAGQESPPLFTEIRASGPQIDVRYLGRTFTADVLLSAVQSENNGSTVFDASGWPEEKS